jgi:hypothetical protein
MKKNELLGGQWGPLGEAHRALLAAGFCELPPPSEFRGASRKRFYVLFFTRISVYSSRWFCFIQAAGGKFPPSVAKGLPRGRVVTGRAQHEAAGCGQLAEPARDIPWLRWPPSEESGGFPALAREKRSSLEAEWLRAGLRAGRSLEGSSPTRRRRRRPLPPRRPTGHGGSPKPLSGPLRTGLLRAVWSGAGLRPSHGSPSRSRGLTTTSTATVGAINRTTRTTPRITNNYSGVGATIKTTTIATPPVIQSNNVTRNRKKRQQQQHETYW